MNVWCMSRSARTGTNVTGSNEASKGDNIDYPCQTTPGEIGVQRYGRVQACLEIHAYVVVWRLMCYFQR